MKSIHVVVRRMQTAISEIEVADDTYELLRNGTLEIDDVVGYAGYDQLQAMVKDKTAMYDYRFEDEDGEVIEDFDGPDAMSNYLY